MLRVAGGVKRTLCLIGAGLPWQAHLEGAAAGREVAAGNPLTEFSHIDED